MASQIEHFQGDPQLLDARLKNILPPVVDAYVEHLQRTSLSRPPISSRNVDFQTAICALLYTLCKVRGYKVVIGFFNNEPRYLEPVLARLEALVAHSDDDKDEWRVAYVLLLWLSHLLLTPFDLASISDKKSVELRVEGLTLLEGVPPLVLRVLDIGFGYLPQATKAQDAAAMLLLRLAMRPDMQKLQVGDALVSKALRDVQNHSSGLSMTIYKKLGPLRFLAGVASSSELAYLVPEVYLACETLSIDASSAITSNAVAKKLILKILRSTVVLSLRSDLAASPLPLFIEATSALENVIDYTLRSLGDRDTPVRHAAAKALSLIVLELHAELGQDIIQAVLDMFRGSVRHRDSNLDFRDANALTWHGLTLTLAHVLFKRSASVEQLPEIVDALTLALQFEQRAATGGSIGTNVRDAANFGIWSLSRRYTTKELLSVDSTIVSGLSASNSNNSIIQSLATQLLLSACLDPAGNIRRGSSAALQELIGRHPNQVSEGISLVQAVDYLAVGLRRRAMVDVAHQAASLARIYCSALIDALYEWRGLRSPDVSAREAAAASLASLSITTNDKPKDDVLMQVTSQINMASSNDVEVLHGLVLSLAILLQNSSAPAHSSCPASHIPDEHGLFQVGKTLEAIKRATKDFSPRLIRSELPAASIKLSTALCDLSLKIDFSEEFLSTLLDSVEALTERMLIRHEDTIQQAVPALTRSLLASRRKAGLTLGCIAAPNLCAKVSVDAIKSTLHGASRAIALGTLAPLYDAGLKGEKAEKAVRTLCSLTAAMNVEWRVIGMKALQLATEGLVAQGGIDENIAQTVVDAAHCGLNDYTIDERGDVGSLVRLQAISTTVSILASDSLGVKPDVLHLLEADIFRLSLEKLDRVRLLAAQARCQYFGLPLSATDIANVSTEQYFHEALKPLLSPEEPAWKTTALLQGCILCAGISAEPLLQASRSALMEHLSSTSLAHLQTLLSIFASILKTLLLENTNPHPALELLAFLFDMRIPQRLLAYASSDFKWLSLLSTIQKSHHKANDIPRILAALHVYCGLAEVPVIRHEVLKKLLSMLRTNPYPSVRVCVAETLFVVTGEEILKGQNWLSPAGEHVEVVDGLRGRLLAGS